ncbi:MAG: RNA polymerase sigma factor, partial [Patescibacteria group bacterium]
NHFRDASKRVEISLEAIDEAAHAEIESQTEVKTDLLTDGFEQMAKKDAERELMAALVNLSEDKRRLVTMKYLVGYSYEEMGEILEMSTGAIKVATHRAMKELKEKLTGAPLSRE